MTLSRLQDLVVVGVDSTPASARALRWAASEAALRRSGLIITHLEPLDGEEGRFAHLTRRERLLARSAWAVALSPLPVPLSTHLVRGDLRDIGDELIRLSQHAAFVVLRRARVASRAAHETLGTIESRVISDAACPTVLISATSPVSTASGRGVVVSCGPDGGDERVLDLAATEALLRGVPLTIIGDDAPRRGSGTTERSPAAVATSRRHRQGLVASVASGPGDPSALALALAREADLLVVDCGAPASHDGAPGTDPLARIRRAARCPLMLVNARSRRNIDR